MEYLPSKGVHTALPYEIWGYNKPMSILSLTGSGAIVLAVGFILNIFHIQLPSEQIQTFVDAGIKIVGFAMLVWGQLRRPDLVAGMIRRSRLPR